MHLFLYTGESWNKQLKVAWKLKCINEKLTASVSVEMAGNTYDQNQDF